MDPRYSGPGITAQNSDVHTTTDFEPGAAEVLSSEMTHEMSQIGVPHSTHAAFNSVCEGVDAEAHKNFSSCQVHCCCCTRAAYYMEDWMDHPEDERLFGCLFETGEKSYELSVAHIGAATAADARYDKPMCLCGNGSCTNSPNSDKLQADHKCENNICKLCLNASQLSSGSGQSTSSYGETEVCLEITGKYSFETGGGHCF